MKWIAASTATMLLAACGGASTTTGTRAVHPIASETASGVRVIALRRPTPDRVHLSLFVDAGSRDADPPQLATVAAWLAAARADADARVVPDGTELALDCAAADVAACLARLRTALALREPSEDDVAGARRRIAEVRRLAAADPAAVADRLAVGALLDPEGAGLAALGAAADDAHVTADAVRAFLGRHYGPGRALVVVAGELDPEAITARVDETFEDAPAASAARASRNLHRADLGTAIGVEVGEAGAVTFAAATRDLAEAAALARAAGRTAVARSAHAFEVRGGALVLVRAEAADADGAIAAAEALLFEMGRLRAEGAPATVLPPRADDPAAAARALGLAWIAEAPGAPVPMMRVAIGAVVPGGRADDVDAADPDRALRDRVRVAVGEAARRAEARIAPRTRGDVRDDAASVVLDNGARIEARRRPGDQRVAFAVRFAGGAAADPPDAHGRAALLATLAATHCEGLPPGALAARLESLGATLTPSVDASSWGIVLEAPRAAWRPALDVTLRCALLRATPARPAASPPRSRATGATARAIDLDALEHARLALLSRLRADPTAALAARALAPRTPGFVAPLGTADGLAGVGRTEAAEALDEARVGARTTVAVVGDVPLDDAIARLARRLAGLPSGAAPSPIAAAPEETEDPLGARSPDTTVRAVIAWRAQGADRAGASAFAYAIAGGLEAEAALRVTAIRSGAGRWGAWAAVTVEPTEEQLARLPAAIAGATQRATSTLDAAASTAAAALASEEALSQARPAFTAERLAARRAGSAVERPTPETARATARALAAARAHVVVLRPP